MNRLMKLVIDLDTALVIRKYELIQSIARKNQMHLSSWPDESKLVDKVYKQLDRLSIDVLEYLNNCK